MVIDIMQWITYTGGAMVGINLVLLVMAFRRGVGIFAGSVILSGLVWIYWIASYFPYLVNV